MFANRISSSTTCSICLPETSPPSSARAVLRHHFQSCNTSEGAPRVTWKHYGAAYRRRREFNDWCQRVFERFDLLLCPVLPTEAFPAKGPMPTEINGQPLKDPLNAVVFTYPFNMSGHPGARFSPLNRLLR
jgi:hypothetical protein